MKASEEKKRTQRRPDHGPAAGTGIPKTGSFRAAPDAKAGVSGKQGQRNNRGSQSPSRPAQTGNRVRSASSGKNAASRQGQTNQNGNAAAPRREARTARPTGRTRSGRPIREQYVVQKKKKKRTRVWIGRIFLVLILYALLMAATGIAFASRLHEHTDSETFDYRYQIGADDDPSRTSRIMAWESVYRNGTKYINFTELASICEFTTTGDSDTRRFLTEADESVTFDLGGSLVYVNGIAVRMGAPTVFENGTLYVPMDFVAHYMTGVTATYDEELHKITVRRIGQMQKTGEYQYRAVGFILKAQPPCVDIPLSSLPYEILSKTVVEPDADPLPGTSDTPDWIL